MDLKLRVLEGKNAGKEIAVRGPKFLIGRADDCQLRAGSELISRYHCALLLEEGHVSLQDFGSKNGTFVNEERVVGQRELKPGDRLTVGPLRFEVHLEHTLSSQKRPPVGDIKQAAARTAADAAQDAVDVTQWLSSEGETATPPPKQASTETVNLSDTESIKMSATQTMVTGPADENKAKGPLERKLPGKLPVKANTTKDSQEAAKAMLDRMRRTR